VLAGRELARSEFRVPTLATTDLTGVAVREVVSRGKHQLFRFANDLTLHTHFRMEGAWRIYARGRKWTGGPDFQIRAVLATADHDAVGYRSRSPSWCRPPTRPAWSGTSARSPRPDWDLDEALRRISRQPERTIGEALIDQRNLAGHRHVLPAELLFLQGMHPRTPIAAVPNLRRVVQRGQQLLYANPLASRAVDDRGPAT
jgi:endonuclease-8